jgi:hypothetical protein
MACRFQTDFQLVGRCPGSQLVISSSTERFNQMEDAVATEKQNREPQTARLAALFSLKRRAYMRMSRTDSPVRIGMTRLNVRRNCCSTSTRAHSGKPRMLGRQKRNNPNSAQARNPGTIKSKNSKKSIKAEDKKESTRNPSEKIHQDFVEKMSLFHIAEVGGSFEED